MRVAAAGSLKACAVPSCVRKRVAQPRSPGAVCPCAPRPRGAYYNSSTRLTALPGCPAVRCFQLPLTGSSCCCALRVSSIASWLQLVELTPGRRQCARSASNAAQLRSLPRPASQARPSLARRPPPRRRRAKLWLFLQLARVLYPGSEYSPGTTSTSGSSGEARACAHGFAHRTS